MALSIKEVRLGNESRVKVLLQDSVPVYWPVLYVLKKMRSRSPNTQQRFLSDLLVFFTWLDAEKIDLEARLKQRPEPMYLTERELYRFSTKAHWTKETLDKLYSGVRLHGAAYRQVGASQAESRIITAKNYLGFLYEALGDPDSFYEQITQMKKRMDLRVKELRPAWYRRPTEPKGLTSEQEDVLLNKLHPESEYNPWPKLEAIRVRNYLIVLLLIMLGIRRGEMLGIKLADVDYRKNRIKIIHRPNDKDDPRVLEPNVKTNERVLPVTEELMAIINWYINKRREFKFFKTHPYLILAHGRKEGSPLSIKSVDAVFNTAKKAFPVLKGVTPHTLRHHDVYQTIKTVSEQTENLPIEDRVQQERRVLIYKFGWSDNSEMPALYGQKYYQEEADKAMMARGRKLLEGGVSKVGENKK